MVDAARALPSPECEVFIAHVGGAMARVPADATAWPNRDAHFVMNAHARWRDKAEGCGLHRMGSPVLRRGRALRVGQRLRQFHAGGRRRPGREAYGANYRRLAEIKRRYDPDNLFRMNQNIRPTA